jgi:hypothetical protein
VTLVDGVVEPVPVTAKLEPIPEAAPPTAPVVAPPPIVDPPATSHTWSWAIGGFGVTALAGAGVAYALRASTLADLDAACDPDRTACDPSKRALDDQGRRQTTIGNVLLGVGAVATTTAVVLFVLESSQKQSASVALTPSGLAIQGRF